MHLFCLLPLSIVIEVLLVILVWHVDIGGRHFESYSEDPVLSGNIAAAYINGLQSEGVGATVKHYAANETEWERRKIDVRISEKALREIYYLPFQIAMRDAQPWCVMTSLHLS